MSADAEGIDVKGTAEQIARPALLLASLAAVTLALTLCWQLVIAALFGASAELDAFWIGAAIPKAIADAFHLGIVTLLFVVVYHMPREEQGMRERDRLSSAVFNLTLLGTLVLAAVLLLAASPIVRLMGPGLDPALQRVAAGTLRSLTWMMIPTVLVGGMAGIFYAKGNFRPFALARALGLLVQIAVLLGLAARLGTNGLVWAFLTGSCVMFLACVPAFRATGARWSPTLDFRGGESAAVLRMLGALLALAVLARANQISDRYFASLLAEGSVSALEFGWRFEIPVSQILAFSVALPSFALMAIHSAAERRDEFRETVVTSLRMTALLVGPVILFLVVMREPLTELWFQRGAFSEDASSTVASLIPWMAVTFAILGIGPVLVFGLLSLQRRGVLVAILVLEVVMNTALNGPLSRAIGVKGIVVATMLAMLTSNAVLWTILAREIGGVARRPAWRLVSRSVVTLAGAAAILAAGRAAVAGLLHESGAAVALMTLAGMGILYLAIYTWLCDRVGLIRVEFRGLRPRLAWVAEP